MPEKTKAAKNSSGDSPPDFTKVNPPKSEPTKGEDSPKPRARRVTTPKAPSLERQLQDAFATISVAIAATGDFYCAEVVANQAEPMAKAWAELASKNDSVRNILERMMQGSAWGGVIFATAATVIPIAAHHGMWPKNMPMPFSFGIGPPPPPSEEVKQQEGNK